MGPDFREHEMVLCYHGPQLYEAKVAAGVLGILPCRF